MQALLHDDIHQSQATRTSRPIDAIVSHSIFKGATPGHCRTGAHCRCTATKSLLRHALPTIRPHLLRLGHNASQAKPRRRRTTWRPLGDGGEGLALYRRPAKMKFSLVWLRCTPLVSRWDGWRTSSFFPSGRSPVGELVTMPIGRASTSYFSYRPSFAGR